MNWHNQRKGASTVLAHKISTLIVQYGLIICRNTDYGAILGDCRSAYWFWEMGCKMTALHEYRPIYQPIMEHGKKVCTDLCTVVRHTHSCIKFCCTESDQKGTKIQNTKNSPHPKTQCTHNVDKFWTLLHIALETTTIYNGIDLTSAFSIGASRNSKEDR